MCALIELKQSSEIKVNAENVFGKFNYWRLLQMPLRPIRSALATPPHVFRAKIILISSKNCGIEHRDYGEVFLVNGIDGDSEWPFYGISYKRPRNARQA